MPYARYNPCDPCCAEGGVIATTGGLFCSAEIEGCCSFPPTPSELNAICSQIAPSGFTFLDAGFDILSGGSCFTGGPTVNTIGEILCGRNVPNGEFPDSTAIQASLACSFDGIAVPPKTRVQAFAEAGNKLFDFSNTGSTGVVVNNGKHRNAFQAQCSEPPPGYSAILWGAEASGPVNNGQDMNDWRSVIVTTVN
jgi:hypothetical protein